MSPLFLANWQEINRVFCAVCWIAALVLAVVILGIETGASKGVSLGRPAQTGSLVVPASAVQPHRHP